jgi:hypothetical protein
MSPPHEHWSHTYPLSTPPSSTPHRRCSATKATKALKISGMGPGDYHSVNAPRYHTLDCVWGTGPESALFLPHHHPVLRGGGGPSFPVPRQRASPVPISTTTGWRVIGDTAAVQLIVSQLGGLRWSRFARSMSRPWTAC